MGNIVNTYTIASLIRGDEVLACRTAVMGGFTAGVAHLPRLDIFFDRQIGKPFCGWESLPGPYRKSLRSQVRRHDR
jgi:hypothetical protein